METHPGAAKRRVRPTSALETVVTGPGCCVALDGLVARVGLTVELFDAVVPELSDHGSR
jgi:hypothetical protein